MRFLICALLLVMVCPFRVTKRAAATAVEDEKLDAHATVPSDLWARYEFRSGQQAIFAADEYRGGWIVLAISKLNGLFQTPFTETGVPARIGFVNKYRIADMTFRQKSQLKPKGYCIRTGPIEYWDLDNDGIVDGFVKHTVTELETRILLNSEFVLVHTSQRGGELESHHARGIDGTHYKFQAGKWAKGYWP